MNRISIYTKAVNDAFVVSENVLGERTKMSVSNSKEELLKAFAAGKYIKVPFVGDFNAGKSSMINAMIAREVLPTDIVPTTAVSYELYYEKTERLEQWRMGNKIADFPLSQIGNITVSPGDVMKTYLDNEQVRQWNERGIVVVDMPGIDSGIQEHNDAIMNYVMSDGTFFVIASPAEAGTLRNTTIEFLKEIQQYNISSFVVITKCDAKPAEDIKQIKELIEKQVSVYVKGAQVGLSSSHKKMFSDVLNAINGIDVEQLTKKKYQARTLGFVEMVIADVQKQFSLLKTDKIEFDAKKLSILESYRNAEKKLEAAKGEMRSASEIADKIANSLSNALEAKAVDFSRMLAAGGKSAVKSIEAELLSTIRPIMIKGFEEEMKKSSEKLGEVLQGFSAKIGEIVEVNTAGVVKRDFTSISTMISSVLLRKIPVLGPVISIALPLLNDLLQGIFDVIASLFGVDVNEKITNTFREQIIPRIVRGLREETEKMVKEQQHEMLAQANAALVEEKDKINAQMEEIERAEKMSEAAIQTKRAAFEEVFGKLEEVRKMVA